MNQPRVIDEKDMPPELDEAIRRDLCRAHPSGAATFKDSRSWHGSFPAYTVVLEDGGDVVAHAGVVERRIGVGADGRDGGDCVPLTIAGVQNVYVLPECRGRGLSRPVLAMAMREAAARGHDAGLLFCKPELEKVYAACGWKILDGRESVRIENGAELSMKGRIMHYPLATEDFPDGVIHLRGNDW